VRARLEANDIDTENQVYMVTSAKKDTGKTFVAMNLALVLALANRRVLFIDADLRKGKASRLWNAPECGLTDYLNGTADDISQLFYHPEQYPTLDILPSGIAPANPTELLSNSLLGEFLCLVRPVYDYIIIDTPKANDLADAEIISRYADCQLTIIRAGVFERSNLDQLKQKENEESARLVILNGVSNEGFA
jgi:capsular exopolysaccharide synthesis family protein